MKQIISHLFSTVVVLLATALSPAKAFSLGCIGEWPGQVCVQGRGWDAFGWDRLVDEIACKKITVPGEVDSALMLVLQSNKTAWAKNVAVIESGWAGRRHIANILVPLNPVVRRDNRGFIPEDVLTYAGNGLILEIHVLRIAGRSLNGAFAKLSLPGYEPENIVLNCDYAKQGE